MSSDDEFDNSWLDSAEVDAVALAIERGEMGDTGRIEIEMEGVDGHDTTKKRDRSSSVEFVEKPSTNNPYRTPYQRFRQHAGFLAATDIADVQWCSYQKLYKELAGGGWIRVSEQKRSIIGDSGAEVKMDKDKALAKQRIMDKGSAHHDKLEREMYQLGDMEMITVNFHTKLDYYALWLHNCIIQLTTLEMEGKCREFGVRGLINGQIVQGDIDELRLDRKTGMVRVVDDKTRADGKMPNYRNSSRGSPNNRAQIMVYRKLLSEFPFFDWPKWFEERGIDMEGEVETPIIRQQLLLQGEPDLRLSAIHERYKALTVAMLDKVDPIVELDYHRADDGAFIGKVEIEYDEEELNRYINDAFNFWHHGDYKGIDMTERYKCNTCEFESSCEWLAEQHKRAVERNRKKLKA